MNSQAMYLPLLISSLAFLISLISFVYFKSYLKRRTSQERILAELQEEVNSILKSINDTTERNISLIEDSEKKLKNLLGEIEKRLRVYVREMERFGNYRVSETRTPDAAPHGLANNAENRISSTADKPAATQYQELGKNRYRLTKPNQSQSAEPVQTAESGQAPAAAQAAKPEPAFPIPNFDIKADTVEKPPLTEQVRSLLLSGFSASIVAGRLGVSIAEVELAAALLGHREE